MEVEAAPLIMTDVVNDHVSGQDHLVVDAQVVELALPGTDYMAHLHTQHSMHVEHLDPNVYSQSLLEHNIHNGFDSGHTDQDDSLREQRRVATQMYRMRMRSTLSADELAAKRQAEAERKRLARARMSQDELQNQRARNAQQKREARARMTAEQLAIERQKAAERKRAARAKMSTEELATARERNRLQKREARARLTEEEAKVKRAEHARRRRLARARLRVEGGGPATSSSAAMGATSGMEHHSDTGMGVVNQHTNMGLLAMDGYPAVEFQTADGTHVALPTNFQLDPESLQNGTANQLLVQYARAVLSTLSANGMQASLPLQQGLDNHLVVAAGQEGAMQLHAMAPADMQEGAVQGLVQLTTDGGQDKGQAQAGVALTGQLPMLTLAQPLSGQMHLQQGTLVDGQTATHVLVHQDGQQILQPILLQNLDGTLVQPMMQPQLVVGADVQQQPQQQLLMANAGDMYGIGGQQHIYATVDGQMMFAANAEVQHSDGLALHGLATMALVANGQTHDDAQLQQQEAVHGVLQGNGSNPMTAEVLAPAAVQPEGRGRTEQAQAADALTGNNPSASQPLPEHAADQAAVSDMRLMHDHSTAPGQPLVLPAGTVHPQPGAAAAFGEAVDYYLTSGAGVEAVQHQHQNVSELTLQVSEQLPEHMQVAGALPMPMAVTLTNGMIEGQQVHGSEGLPYLQYQQILLGSYPGPYVHVTEQGIENVQLAAGMDRHIASNQHAQPFVAIAGDGTRSNLLACSTAVTTTHAAEDVE